MPVLKIHPATSQERSFQWNGTSCDIGRAPTNHLPIDDNSISSYHARIELRGQTYYILDLNSTNGTFHNGHKIKEAELRDGDEIRLGEHVKLLFTCPAEVPTGTVTVETAPFPPAPPQAQPMAQEFSPSQMPPGMGLQLAAQSQAIMPQGMQCPSCRTLVPFQVNFCPRCGFSLAQQAPLGFPMPQQPVGYVRPMDHSSGMSVGMLPLLALLCGVFGFLVVPSLLAIILGLAALGQIRRLGGMESDRKQATWGVILGFFWIVAALGVGGYFGYGRYQERQKLARQDERVLTEKQMAENEANAITILKGIARAQKLAKVVRLKDPNKTGTGQFLTLTELAEAGTSFFRRDLASGRAQGYTFSILDPGEAKFLAVAEPEKYDQTGKRAFTVDSSGIIRGRDSEGKNFAQMGGSLPVLSDQKPAFDGIDDAIAGEAIAHAKRLADAGQYDACRLILDDIAGQFAMTTAAQELAAIKKTVDPFIIEAQAQIKHQKATAAATAGDVKLAIALLKEILEIYPSYTKISAVTDTLNQHQTALTQAMDKAAKELFDKAEAFEREGKPDAALDIFVQIEKNYPGTEYAKRITELRPALLKSIRETTAEQLFAQCRELSVTNDCRNIVNLIQQLQRNYTDTDYVRNNATGISRLFQKAQAEYYRALAVEQMTAGKDADALARLEEACTHNADARPGFRDLFLKLYLRVGRKRMDEGDSREALRLYRNYLALEPEQNEVPAALISKLQFQLARSDFAQGNYYNAAQLLVGARKEFDKDPEYNDLFASVQVALGNYLDALTYYDRAITAKPNVGNYYARRGYAQLVLALQTERETMTAFAGLLQDAAATNGKSTKPSKTDTNNPAIRIVVDGPGTAAPAPAAETTDTFAPIFATILPPTATGVKPEMQVRYDAIASQKLLDEILDMLDGITATNTSSKVRSAVRNPPSGTRGGGGSSSNAADSTDAPEAPGGKTRDRLARIRTTVGFNNALSSLRQRILDLNSRRNKSAEAMRRMTAFYTSGSRDLAKAIELGADRAPALMEILKTAQQHERKIAQAVPLISSYLFTESDIIDRVTQMTETVFQSLRIQHTSMPMDPTATLDIYFSRYLDRRDFDKGVQILRESGAVKVPLETYSVIPTLTPTAPVTTPSQPPPTKTPPPTPPTDTPAE